MADTSFARPEFLYAVAPAILLILIGAAINRKRSGSRLRLITSTLLRSVAITLLLLAAAGPYRTLETRQSRGTILLADDSGSISADGRAELDKVFADLQEEGPTTRVTFGTERSSDPRASLLGAAVGGSERIALLTDGHLDADATDLLADLAAAGRSTGVKSIEAERGEHRADIPQVPAISVPRPLREGAPLDIRVTARGAREVVISIDGDVAGRAGFTDGTAHLKGITMVAGPHEITALVTGPGGGAAAAEMVHVEGPLRVLVLGSTADGAVPRALAAQGLTVAAGEDMGPAVPDLTDIRVVLALSGFSLPRDGGPLLPFVTRGGGLLVATGAPPGLSRYEDTPIADLLPAAAIPAEPEVTPPPPDPPPPEEKPPEEGASPAEVDKDALTITLLLVVDRSGSMRGGKIDIAKAACMAAAQTLDQADRIGVLAFNENVQWIQRPAPAGDLLGLRRALSRLTPNGGTEIFVALREAYAVIRKEKSGIKHVILISDGQDLLAGFKKLILRMVGERITLSTVGVGNDYEPRLLGPLARWGRGRFYPANDPRELPQVVTMDTRRVIKTERPVETEPSPDVTAGSSDPEPPEPDEAEQPPPTEPVPVTVAAPLPFLAGLTFPTLPEVEPVEPRFPAQTALVTMDGNSALTFWRFGEGRVAHFAGELTAWADWEDYPRFLAQLCRQLAGATEEATAPGPDVAIAGHRVIARTPEPPRAGTVLIEGEQSPLTFARTGPGVYAADLPTVPAGTLIRARVEGADGALAGAVAVAARAGEDLAAGVDDRAIAALSAAAGGGMSGIPDAPDDRRLPGREPVHIPLLFVALCLLPLDIAVRRIGR